MNANRLHKLIALVLSAWALGGCDGVPNQRGSCFLPQAVIGIAVEDEGGANRARTAVSRFARQNGLRAEHVHPYEWQPEWLRKELSETPRTNFGPPEYRRSEG